jgi:hypothetical protein
MQPFVNSWFRLARTTGLPMLDAAMLIGGIGVFALFLGYISVCENL